MSRIASSDADVQMRAARRQFVPIVSTIFACLLGLLPVVMNSPIVPDFALITLISWRLLRPEMWSPTTALPLGLFNDLVVGHPIGQSMALWTALFLIYEIMDARVVWRDYWMDWFVAAMSILFCSVGAWFIGLQMGNKIEFMVLLPQIGLSVLTYPIVASLALRLDRWRLTR